MSTPQDDQLREPPSECDACRYETWKLHRTDPPFMSRRKEPYYFCDLCWSSFAGNSVQYPDQYPDRQVLCHVNLTANKIIERLDEVLSSLRGTHNDGEHQSGN